MNHLVDEPVEQQTHDDQAFSSCGQVLYHVPGRGTQDPKLS